ncbi:hypothetical protein D3C74_383290 [compost metagenome]
MHILRDPKTAVFPKMNSCRIFFRIACFYFDQNRLNVMLPHCPVADILQKLSSQALAAEPGIYSHIVDD